MNTPSNLSALKVGKLKSSSPEETYSVKLRGVHTLVDGGQETANHTMQQHFGDEKGIYDGDGRRVDKKPAATFGVQIQTEFTGTKAADGKKLVVTPNTVTLEVPAAIVNEILRSTRQGLRSVVSDLPSSLTDELRKLPTITQATEEMRQKIIQPVVTHMTTVAQQGLQDQDFARAITRETTGVFSKTHTDTVNQKALNGILRGAMVPLIGLSRAQVAHILETDKKSGRAFAAQDGLSDWKSYFTELLPQLELTEFAELMAKRPKYADQLRARGMLNADGTPIVEKFTTTYQSYVKKGQTLDQLAEKVAKETKS